MVEKDDTQANYQADGPKKLYRLPSEGMITGVAAGLAKYLGMDVALVRLLLVVIAFITGGLGVVVYVIAAIIMPTPDKPTSGDIGARVESFTTELKTSRSGDRLRNWIGLALILFGAWMLLDVFWPQWADLRWNLLWPTVLIIIGVVVLMRGRKLW